MADRSPNYPGFALSKAVGWARALKGFGGRNAVHIETVAKATGSEATKGISGPTRQKIGAMRQFGLIESAAQGQYRLSGTGFDLALHQSSDPEYAAALQKAALRPPLFLEVYHRYNGIPHDHELSVALQKGIFGGDFSPESARRFIRAFKETMAFAKLDSESYTNPNENESDDSIVGPVDGAEQTTPAGFRIKGGPKVPPLNLALAPGVSAQIAFTGSPTPRAIEKLIALLDLMKDGFDDHEPRLPPEN